MAVIGSFGRDLAVAEDPDTFLWHGEEFTVPPNVSAMPVLAFAASMKVSQDQIERAGRNMRHARSDDEKDRLSDVQRQGEMTQMAAVHQFMHDTIGPDQFARFTELAQMYGDGLEETMRVVQAIYSTLIDERPTQRSTGSSGGPSTSGPGSPDVSPSPEPGRAEMTELERYRAEMGGHLVSVEDRILSSASR